MLEEKETSVSLMPTENGWDTEMTQVGTFGKISQACAVIPKDALCSIVKTARMVLCPERLLMMLLAVWQRWNLFMMRKPIIPHIIIIAKGCW